MPPLLQAKHASLADLCASYAVERLDLFGSAATGEFDPITSDLDFVVTFAPHDTRDLFDRFFGLQGDLEVLFGRKVDLITDRSIRNPYFRRVVDQTRVNVYDARPATIAV